jgi:hypothetical protein
MPDVKWRLFLIKTWLLFWTLFTVLSFSNTVSETGSISVIWCKGGKVPTHLCLWERVGLDNMFEKSQDDGQCLK